MNKIVVGIIIAIGLLILTEKGGEPDDSMDSEQNDVYNGGGSGAHSGKHTTGGKGNWNCIIT